MGTTFGIYSAIITLFGAFVNKSCWYLPCLCFFFPSLETFFRHFLGAAGVFFAFLCIFTLDEDVRNQRRDTIRVFWTVWWGTTQRDQKGLLNLLIQRTPDSSYKQHEGCLMKTTRRELQRGRTTQSDNCDKDKPNQHKITKETLMRRFVIVSSYFKQRTLCFELMCL